MRGAGNYPHRVTIHALTTSQDDMGATVEAWAALRSVWAKIRPLAGKEARENARTQATMTHEVYLRSWWSDLKPSMRVVYQCRTLEIVAPPKNVNEAGTETYLLCREIVQ